MEVGPILILWGKGRDICVYTLAWPNRRRLIPPTPTHMHGCHIMSQRPLHWVFKVGDLKQTLNFYEGSFGMHVHRHEEFASGCEATCNGPYGGSWSKTMVGYGREDENYALELTANVRGVWLKSREGAGGAEWLRWETYNFFYKPHMSTHAVRHRLVCAGERPAVHRH